MIANRCLLCCVTSYEVILFFILVSPTRHDVGLFSTEMVSVPTSGKKIQDEKETFKTLLQAIGLKPKVAEEKDTAKYISLTTTLKYAERCLADAFLTPF